MTFLIYTLPIVIVAAKVGYRAWRIWKNGLFMALMQLAISVVAAVAAFLLTRLLIDPAKVDLFGIGGWLVSIVPNGFFEVMPKWADFLRALPTALIALFGFTVFFDVIHNQGVKLLNKLNAKHHWSDKYLKLKCEKLLTVCTGVLIAVVCLAPTFVLLCGTLPFTTNMLYCAQTATGQEFFGGLGDVLQVLDESPLIRLGNALGADDAYYALTSAKRGDEDFSVGQELNQLSLSFVGVLPVIETLDPNDGLPPSPEDLRQLPGLLGETQESLALTVGIARSYSEDLGASDAVWIISSFMDTDPARFTEYLQQLDMETAQEDMTTFCEIAAILSERDLLPDTGEMFDQSALQDEALKAQIRTEVMKNSHLAEFFLPGAEI